MLKTYAVHFCGVGGACQGIHAAGLECKLAIDFWQPALDVREANLKHKGLCIDVNAYQPDPAHSADLLWTSPVCQSFSTANREEAKEKDIQGIEEVRDDLYLASVKYLKHFKPKYFIFENVTGLLTHMGGETLNQIRMDFKDAGYHCEYNVFDTYCWGLPQHRERLFIVGSSNGKRGLLPRRPKAKPLNLAGIAEHGMEGHAWGGETYQTAFNKVERTGISMAIINPEKDVFPTITCAWGGGPTRMKVGILDKTSSGVPFVRYPTVLEGSLAQGFPSNWTWPSNESDAWKMIGNAVAPPMAQALVEHLQKIEAGEKPPAAKPYPDHMRGHIPSGIKSLAEDTFALADGWFTKEN